MMKESTQGGIDEQEAGYSRYIITQQYLTKSKNIKGRKLNAVNDDGL